MYENFFRLREKPFSLTPDSQIIFPSKKHTEALEHLRYGIIEKKGFILITGEAGSGKTTLCRSFLKNIESDIEIALILNSFLSELELLRAINRDFGIDSNGETREQLVSTLNDFLLRKKEERKTVVVMVDESQNLSIPVLEQLRMLSNLETEKEKLLQIVLIGQPELDETLEKYELRQLNQRITVRYHISPLDIAETKSYIKFRLQAVSEDDVMVHFHPPAIRKIRRASRGLPRNINVLCDHILLAAYVNETFSVTPKLVQKSMKELKWRKHLPHFKIDIPWQKVFAGSAAGFLIVATLFLGKTALNRFNQEEKIAANVPLPAPVQPKEKIVFKPAVQPAKVKPAYFSSLESALWECAKIWPNKNIDAYQNIRDRRAALKQSGFEIAETWAGLKTLAKINLPTVLQVNFPYSEENRFIVLTAVGSKRARILSDKGVQELISLNDIEKLWHGKAFIPYSDPEGGQFSQIFIQNMKGSGVELLQKRLHELGYLQIISGTYDNQTQQAVEQFQKEMDFPVDGVAGTETHLALFQKSHFQKTNSASNASADDQKATLITYEDENL